jgi:type I restriction enzyme S subunit
MSAGFDLDKFVASFPVLAEAEGGTKRLRAMVLKLGLAGRLGTNDSREKKVDFVSKAKPAKLVTPVHPNWVAYGLEDLAEIEMGNSPPGTSYNDHGAGVPLINGPVEFSPGPFGFTKRTKFTTEPARMCRAGDLLVCVRGATTGRTNIAAFDACIGRGVAAIRAKGDQQYVNYFMWSVGTDLLAAGTGTTFPAISKDDLVALVMLVPPPAEQKRIVAKIDELMRLIDDLEAKQAKKREVQTRFRTSVLDTLTRAEGAEELGAAWKRVAGNFDIVFAAAQSVTSLRRLLWEMATRGQLGTERSSDEPVGALWDRIQQERGGLLEGRRRGGRGHQAESDEPAAQPHPIPASWLWCRLGDVAGHIVDGTHHTPTYVSDGVAFISAKDVKGGTLSFDKCKYITADEFAQLANRCRPKRGDVLITKSGSIGEVAVVDTDRVFTLFESVALVPVVPSVDARFIAYVAYLGASGQFGNDNQKGVGVTHLHLVDLRKLPVPLPPLAEQKRIVAKVESLMKLCDDLEARLRAKETTAAKLVEAVVRDLSA